MFFNKYEGKPGFTSVNVSEKLFALAASAAPVSEAEIKELVDGIKSVKILVFENSEDNARISELYKEAEATLPGSGYEELMTVKGDSENVIMLGRTSSESVIEELIMIVMDESDFILVSIIGTIDMKNISRIADMHMDLDLDLDQTEQE
jgi:hypothetical protein